MSCSRQFVCVSIGFQFIRGLLCVQFASKEARSTLTTYKGDSMLIYNTGTNTVRTGALINASNLMLHSDIESQEAIYCIHSNA